MLKGGLTTVSGGRAEIYFESNATADIWVDSVSVKPFTKEEWSTHRDASAGTARRKTVRLQATDSAGNPLPGAAVSLETVRNGFPLGAAMSSEILRNLAYQSWFTSRFTVTTFENEMKWYSTEPAPGREDYSVPDAMLEFAKQHGIAVRGHNVFWDDPNQQPRWGHFTAPVNIPYMRAALDTLAQAGVPVWLTEVDVAGGPSQAYYLEEVLREAYAHPAVQGVILWAAWRPQGCYVMCLTDNEFNNLPQGDIGDIVDQLITEWTTAPRAGTTDAEGFFQAELAHGEYKVTVTHPSLNTSVSQSVKVELGSGSHYFIQV
ncbi:hypothetical protein E2562_031200 [Oryza meyeriana var. granulata]|uniref:GH10 domain-containing protein n=1 Tax=Oryza meyeriana var. granulata TaxID=110450 RepID=A0A6G1DR52_9ORYZ|nr:hypothetical protein E2562_031200 [Oryza meyeriana var. granulata]